jgi:hypothetical protein
MLTPGMLRREFGPKVANLVKVYEDHRAPMSMDLHDEEEEEEDFEPITLAEFLAMTNISFLDGLGPSMRRRTFVPPEGLGEFSRKAGFGDYAKAGAVSIPMLELYQFVPIPIPRCSPANWPDCDNSIPSVLPRYHPVSPFCCVILIMASNI